MKKTISVLISFSMILLLSCTGSISGSVEKITGKANITAMSILGGKASSAALEKLQLKKWDKMLVLTNASYSKPMNTSSAPFLDGVIALTGCTPGASTLGVIHSTKDAPLWMSVTDPSGNSVYVQIKPEVSAYTSSQIESKSEKDLFTVIETRKTGFDEMLSSPKNFYKDIKNGTFGGNLFRVTGISNAWRHPAFKNNIFRAMMLHNHFCPGLGSGCLIAKYTEKKFPLKKNESYVVIACPNWCKEDAFQELFDSTPGKRGLYVKALKPEQKKVYDAKYGGVAGIIIKWNRKKKTGSGIVVGFNFKTLKDSKSRKLSDRKLGTVLKLYQTKLIMDSMSTPEKYVSIIKTFKLNTLRSFNRLKQAGVNPLQELRI